MTGAPFVGIDARRTTPAEPAVRMCAQSVIGKRINTHTALTVDEWRANACRTPCSPWDMRFPLCVGRM